MSAKNQAPKPRSFPGYPQPLLEAVMAVSTHREREAYAHATGTELPVSDFLTQLELSSFISTELHKLGFTEIPEPTRAMWVRRQEIGRAKAAGTHPTEGPELYAHMRDMIRVQAHCWERHIRAAGIEVGLELINRHEVQQVA